MNTKTRKVVRLYNVWTGKYLGEEGWFNSSRKDARVFPEVIRQPVHPAYGPPVGGFLDVNAREWQLMKTPNVVAVHSKG